MAKQRFLVVEDSYINGRLIRGDFPAAQRVVEIETDVSKGGMTPGANLVACDEQGNPVTDKASAGKGKKPATAGEGEAGDLA